MPLQLVSKQWIELVHSFAANNPEMKSFCFGYLPMELLPKKKDYLKHFCFCITYQAISATICGQMWMRFKKLMQELGHTKVWPPEIVASLTDEQLISHIKLSRRKADAVRNIAFYLMENPIDVNKDTNLLINEITSSVKGVGPFTVKYFLFDCLGRLDIALYEDLLVRKGLKIIHKLDKIPTVGQCKKLTQKWGPLASIGSLICYNIYRYR